MIVCGHGLSSDHERLPSPSEAIVDSQSVETATMIHQAVGYDAAKKIKGRKRHLTVDTLGLVLRVLVTAANVPEREGGKQDKRQSSTDGGYGVSSEHDLG
jgi:putative transposase